MALDKITTNIIEDDAITAAKIVAGAVTADIPTGGVSGDKIGYFENPTATQNLTGTYSTQRMYLNDSYTLTGDVTLSGHLTLGTVADADVVITNDSTARTITGNSGTLEGGRLLSKPKSDLTGMTGVVGQLVTGGGGLTSLGTVSSGTFNSTIGASSTVAQGGIFQVIKNFKQSSGSTVNQNIVDRWTPRTNDQNYNVGELDFDDITDHFIIKVGGIYWFSMRLGIYRNSSSLGSNIECYIKTSANQGGSWTTQFQCYGGENYDGAYTRANVSGNAILDLDVGYFLRIEIADTNGNANYAEDYNSCTFIMLTST